LAEILKKTLFSEWELYLMEGVFEVQMSKFLLDRCLLWINI